MIDVAVIGAGWVTSARHIPSLLKSGRCRVVGIVDRHRDRAEAMAKRHGIANVAESLDAPWLDGVRACTVGVAPLSHFEVVRTLLERGKHVLMEKPMCATVAEGEQLVRLAQDRGIVLGLFHNFQFARSAMKAKRAIASGKWGNVLAVHGFQLSSPDRRLPTWYEELPLGLFYDESPHLIYLLRAFAGEVRFKRAWLTPSTRGQVTPALLQVEMESSAGMPASLFMNFEAPISEWQLMVLTERGAALIDVFRDILVFVPHDGRHEARDVVRSSFRLLWDHALGFVRSGLRMVTGQLLYGNEEVVRRFLDAVEGKAPLHDIDALSGLEVLRLQHAILAAVGPASPVA